MQTIRMAAGRYLRLTAPLSLRSVAAHLGVPAKTLTLGPTLTKILTTLALGGLVALAALLFPPAKGDEIRVHLTPAGEREYALADH